MKMAVTQEGTDVGKYRITLVESVEQEGSIGIKDSDGNVVAFYMPKASIPEEELLEHYETKEKLGRAIWAGVENAGAVFGVHHVVSPTVTIVPSRDMPGLLEITADIPGTEPYTVIDGIWDK
jgi:hypothetical protein